MPAEPITDAQLAAHIEALSSEVAATMAVRDEAIDKLLQLEPRLYRAKAIAMARDYKARGFTKGCKATARWEHGGHEEQVFFLGIRDRHCFDPIPHLRRVNANGKPSKLIYYMAQNTTLELMQ